ncbi:MAG: hypothetical protein H6955_01790 [Chromatiaceae bacterium]|nr:hypothetical protein [Gammaproteobacteria bacterium]MCP5312258.1 hypothetical protein [Chromatiaceae bacterium]
MPSSRYFMRDMNHDKIEGIMDFNVAARGNRSRSVFEIGVFFAAVTTYLCALALSA